MRLRVNPCSARWLRLSLGRLTRISPSPFLQVTERSGFNSYFPMPYKNGMRMTLQNDGSGEIMVWFQADYHSYK